MRLLTKGILGLLILLVLMNSCDALVHQKDELQKNIGPPDTIAILPDSLSGVESGYFKLLWSDGSLARLDHLCLGKTEGVVLFFNEAGLISIYAEYVSDSLELKLVFDDLGNPFYTSFEKRVFTHQDTSIIPLRVQNALNFVNQYCPNSESIDWKNVLVNECN